VAVAGPLGVTHFLVFSKSSSSINFVSGAIASAGSGSAPRGDLGGGGCPPCQLGSPSPRAGAFRGVFRPVCRLEWWQNPAELTPWFYPKVNALTRLHRGEPAARPAPSPGAERRFSPPRRSSSGCPAARRWRSRCCRWVLVGSASARRLCLPPPHPPFGLPASSTRWSGTWCRRWSGTACTSSSSPTTRSWSSATSVSSRSTSSWWPACSRTWCPPSTSTGWATGELSTRVSPPSLFLGVPF